MDISRIFVFVPSWGKRGVGSYDFGVHSSFNLLTAIIFFNIFHNVIPPPDRYRGGGMTENAKVQSGGEKFGLFLWYFYLKKAKILPDITKLLIFIYQYDIVYY